MFPTIRAIFAGLALAVLSPVFPGASAQEASSQTPVLHVSGEGRIGGVPDMATIRLGVMAQAATPGEAVEAMNGPMADLLETLLSQDIDPRDIQTSDLSLRAIYADRESPLGEGRAITGYEVSNAVTVQVRALDTLGVVLDQAVGVGSNRFDGLSFGLSDPQPAEDAAMAAAMVDAMRKAQLLAEAAGVALGPILRIDEVARGGSPAPMMRAAMESDMAIAPGSVDTMARVSVSFGISQ